jgi:23S rRNA (cytosine1962-C5)-methyltransferase
MTFEPSQPTAVISAKGQKRVRAGHPWIYRSDLVDVRAEAGDIVRVVGPHERPVGYAFYSDRSQIALRMATRADVAPDSALWRARLASAAAFREALHLDADAYRVVHGEGDLLPSLIVDRYGDCLVVQALSQATDRLLPVIVTMLVDLMSPRGILARNDPRVRLLEGLEQEVSVVYGEVPDSLVVTEGGIAYDVDLRRGQKTGLFLDQRENREAAARYASGRLLDCFSYNGGFALRLATCCRAVTAIDVSEEAVGRIARNAARNHLTNVTAHAANVFDELRRLEHDGERFETIVLDPPAFAKNKAAVPKALAGYKEINLRALKLLMPGGFLVTCSCSYNVDESTFIDVVHDAALDAGCDVTLVEKRTQGRDHPVLLGVPETGYLKCLILRKVG